MRVGLWGLCAFVVVCGCTGLLRTEHNAATPDGGFKPKNGPAIDSGNDEGSVGDADNGADTGSDSSPVDALTDVVDAANDPSGDAADDTSSDAPPDVPPPGPCPATLAERMSTVRIPVTPLSANAGYPVSVVDRGSRIVVAWTDRVEGGGGRARVSQFNASFESVAADIVLDADAAEGLAIDDDGYTVLARRDGSSLATIKVSAEGAVLFDEHRIGDPDHEALGSTWTGGISRIVSTPSGVAIYSPIYQRSGDGLAHQGDTLRSYDADGDLLSGGWGWGCSHSLSQRLAHNGTRLAAVCLSDCYPQKAILLDRSTSIASEPSRNCAGSSDARLGGLVPVEDGFWLTYTSKTGRDSSDVVLTHISNDGSAGPKRYLTEGAAEETGAHLVAYGSGMLVGWREVVAPPVYYLLALDAGGNPEAPAEAVSTVFSDSRDFFRFDNGDAGWAQTTADGTAIEITRLRACE